MQVEVLRSRVSDNVVYVVWDEASREGLLVDPVDAPLALSRASELGVRVRYVVNTHWHPDHTSGNGEALAATGARLLAPEVERGLIEGVNEGLAAGDAVTLGEGRLEVLEVPGHTVGHLALLEREGGHLLSGDLIFGGGVGHARYGGDVWVMARTFREVVRGLPAGLKYYPGHDYTHLNLPFCLWLEPENEEAARWAAALGEGSVPGDLDRERRVSPFLRAGEAGLQARLREQHAQVWEEAGEATCDEDRAFVTLRWLRDRWRPTSR
jgi:hydroxyacylglutathione hydrolase